MLGVLCGLELEARILRGYPSILVEISSARPDAAREGARNLIRRGATVLVSFGLAGGLSPDLKSGDLIIGEGVQSSQGLWAADEDLVESLRQTFPDAQSGLVWGSDHMLDTAELKQKIFTRYQASIVDMESQFVAEAAVAAGLPFMIARAVCDDAEFDLPAAACVPLKDGGRVDLGRVLAACFMAPSDVPSLCRLGKSSQRALKSLVAFRSFLDKNA